MERLPVLGGPEKAGIGGFDSIPLAPGKLVRVMLASAQTVHSPSLSPGKSLPDQAESLEPIDDFCMVF